MHKHWLNDKQPDENGDYILVIENDKGARVSTFKGKSIEEVCEALADSQISANKEIIRLRKPDAARTPLKVEPKNLSAADRLRLSSEITDPERVVEAVEEIVTARQGISPDRVGKQFAAMDQTERDNYYAREAQAFRDANPDYYPVQQNIEALFEELKANGWDLTRNNLAIVFQTLKDRDEMIPWPDDRGENPPPSNYDGGTNGAPAIATPPNGKATAEPAPSPRPRSVSTGIRAVDASASAPIPIKKPKYTRADIERMSRAEYNDKLRSDPDFRRQVDAMGA